MDQYLSEILDQPVALEHLYQTWKGNRELVELGELYRQHPRMLVFLGMGSSNFAPVILRSRFSRAQIPFQILEAGEFVHYEMGSVPSDAWVVAISQSGESLETRVAVEQLRGKVERIIVITNERDSSLAALADTVLLLHAGTEVGSTTKTFSNTLLALHLFANAVEGNERVTKSDINQLITLMDTLQVQLGEKTKQAISYLDISNTDSPDPIHLIARGQVLATALQSALILAETTDLFTHALSGGAFRHGPYELAGQRHRAIVLAPSGSTQHLLVNMAKALHERGSKVVLISDIADDVPCCKLAMPTIREELAPLLYFLPIEFFGWNVSLLRGRIPGMMRHMNKVTVVE